MAKKRFLLRIDPSVHRAIKRWADDDLRSVNAQIEFLLRRALKEAHRDGRLEDPDEEEPGSPTTSSG